MRSLSILSLVSSMMIIPSAGYAITLADTIAAAKGYNFNIKAEDQKVKGSEADRATAYTKFLPTVTSAVTFANTRFTNDQFRKGSTATPSTNNSAITVKQSLFAGGADAYGAQAAEYSLSASKERYRAIINQVLLQTIQAYEDLSTKREVLKLNEENVKVYSELLSLNQTRFELGEITATDIAQTKSRLAEAVSSKEGATAEVMAAEATFESLVGMKAPTELKAVTLDIAKLPKSLDAFLHTTKAKNPSLLQARNQKDAASKSVNIAYAQMLPDVDASIAFSNNVAQKKNLNSSGTTYAITVAMPIFQGGAEYSGIKKSKSKREEAKHTLSQADADLQASAITAWNNYNIYNSILVAKKQAIEAAEKSLAGVREETKMGTRTTLDVLEEQKNLFSAQVSYRKAIQSQVSAFYTIYNLLGELDTIKYT